MNSRGLDPLFGARIWLRPWQQWFRRYLRGWTLPIGSSQPTKI